MRRTAAAFTTSLVAGLVTVTGTGAAQATQAAPAACATPVTHQIAQVQGGGNASPLAGQTVRVEGVVTGDFQAATQLKGFFVQDDTPDDDPATSDGLFVYSTQDVKPGDRVKVTGKVVEYSGLTELSPVTAVDVCGRGKIAPADVKLPLRKGTTNESLEGVLVRYTQNLTATETYDYGRYGSIALSSGGRLFQPTEGHGDTQAGNDARRVLLDDGSSVQNPKPLPFSEKGRVPRTGDSIANVTGVMHEGFGSYRLQPTGTPHFARSNPRPKKPQPVGGNVRVASFNTLNWFTTLNKRGANTTAEQERQLTKLVASLKGLNADVVGLMEVQNNGDTAVKALVDRLNAAVGANTYTWVKHPNPGTDEIHVTLIYKPGKVKPVGAPSSSTAPVFERPPLVQKFQRVEGGVPFTMVVNHFKSKGCGGATGPDADQGDGQSCWNARRVTQAKAIADLTKGLDNPIVLGDLNSYGAEDPIKTLKGAGLASQTERFVREQDRYSYVFQGQSGELDHVLAAKSLNKRITGATIWHINSDEPTIMDYNTEYNPPELYAPDAYRSSDHDPVVIGLDLRK